MPIKPSQIDAHIRTSNDKIAARRLLALKNRLSDGTPARIPATSKKFDPKLTETDDNAEVVIRQHPSGLSKIRLNRPTKLNAISFNMCDIISQAVLAWENLETSKAILITSEGRKAFCAGGDIRDLVDLELQGRHEECIALFQKHPRLNHTVGSINKPLIAFMDGMIMGGGVGLTISAPFRVATENTIHAMPETMIGHFPDASASFWMPRLDGFLGLYLMLTGRRLHGPDVYYSGIATHYVQSKDLAELEMALEELASKTSEVLELHDINAVIDRFSVDMEEKELPFSLGGNSWQAINRCFQHNTMEKIVAALKEEKVAVSWAKETYDLLSRMSPTSLKLSLQLYHTGANLCFVDCMRLEYQLTNLTLASKEFAEGARAALITKTAPNWDPPTLEQVDANEIKKRFFDTPIGNPLQTLLEGGNFIEYPHKPFILPRCSEILDVANKMGHYETVKYFMNIYNGKKGVKTKVVSVLNK
ncbi:ClpP/crotonase-like domain-containing protein [Circinella umbellata]|nr:ClpP/crotonase-like domain-containing protein [Circinella umbellata]